MRRRSELGSTTAAADGSTHPQRVRRSGRPRPTIARMSAFLWIILSIVYIVLAITLGVMTWRGKHYVLFVAGFFLPLFWLIGGVISPRHA